MPDSTELKTSLLAMPVIYLHRPDPEERGYNIVNCMISTPPIRIPVHEQKLAACSPLIRRLLSRAPRPNIRGGPILKFENVEVCTFEAFVEWLYGNSTRTVGSSSSSSSSTTPTPTTPTSSVTNATSWGSGDNARDEEDEGVISEALRAFAREYEVAFLVEEESGCECFGCGVSVGPRRGWRDRGVDLVGEMGGGKRQCAKKNSWVEKTRKRRKPDRTALRGTSLAEPKWLDISGKRKG
ncbi:hypothetical protein PSV08DRAFT_385862 [Bipolaris maydis]|nr:hypothetical protein J3E74DRAFT_452535 [Bipolaris maydis]KAJ6273368.1 hypothetical protein PSV08DRAFT_385862 [Bipolaris maydis]